MSSIDEASEQDPEEVFKVGDHLEYSIGDSYFMTGIIKRFSSEGFPVVIDDDDDATHVAHDNVRLID